MSPKKLQQQTSQFLPYRFLWTRDRILSKLLRVSSQNDLRRFKGLNNNILLAILTFNNNNNNNNNLRGGRSALPRTGLLLDKPVFTGEPRIRLAHSSSRLAHSLLPALCRQESSCAWRLRLRKLRCWASRAMRKDDRRQFSFRLERGWQY